MEIGDIVVLKSGSPKLTVVKVGETLLGDPGVTVGWFDDGEFLTAGISEACLSCDMVPLITFDDD